MADPVRAGDPTCFTVQVATAGQRRRLVVTGELDAISAPLLDEFVQDALGTAGVTDLELDVSCVTFLGAAGVRSLALAHRMADHSDHVLHVHCGGRRPVLRPLQITGLLSSLTAGDRRA
jgi:anti-sigma B factor antagonist